MLPTTSYVSRHESYAGWCEPVRIGEKEDKTYCAVQQPRAWHSLRTRHALYPRFESLHVCTRKYLAAYKSKEQQRDETPPLPTKL